MDNNKTQTYYYEYKATERVYQDENKKMKFEKDIYVNDNGKESHNKIEKILNNSKMVKGGKKYKLRKLY
jgi:hypothetical protein